MNAQDGLIACRSAISNGALSEADLPTEIKLLAWGDNPSTKGNIKVGARTLAALAANQTRLAFDKVGLDYEHQSVAKHPNFKPAPREYAAYGVPEVREGDGLYLTSLSWTPSGQTNARNYCDLSPVVLRQSEEVVFLHSVALCPQGAVAGLEFYTPDPYAQPPMTPELKTFLCSLFGVDESADDAAILAAGQTFAKKEAVEPTEPATELSALAASMEALVKRFDTTQRAQILSTALQAGKLVPASAKDLPLETLSALVEELPAGSVPLESRTPAAVQTLSSQLNAADLAVCAQLNITPESFLKSL
ncbi:MAG: phage protease [Verrucomicrobiae bacterium]